MEQRKITGFGGFYKPNADERAVVELVVGRYPESVSFQEIDKLLSDRGNRNRKAHPSGTEGRLKVFRLHPIFEGVTLDTGTVKARFHSIVRKLIAERNTEMLPKADVLEALGLAQVSQDKFIYLNNGQEWQGWGDREIRQQLNDHPFVKAEHARRLSIWKSLREQGDLNNISPKILREWGVYGGAQGIWVDKRRTANLTGEGPGATVGILHTGDTYEDDLSADGVIYHYPKTQRPLGRDRSEIDATKAAAELGLPVFVITPGASAITRTVHLGWIEDWDELAGLFLITFGESPPAISGGTEDPKGEGSDFELTTSAQRAIRQAFARPGQQRFKFNVFKRYGPQCVVCGIDLLPLLDAAHILSKEQKGSDDPRNGLVLCSLHHRAYDARLFAIHPDTLELVFGPEGPDRGSLRIEFQDLSHLKNKPHKKALASRWLRKPGPDLPFPPL